MKSLESWGKRGFSPSVACRHTSVVSAPETMMLPEPTAVCTVGMAKAPPRLPSWCQWARQPRRFQSGLPLVVCGSQGQQKSFSPKREPLTPGPSLLARVTLRMPGFTTTFWPVQMASGRFLQLQSWSFWCVSRPSPPLTPPGLLPRRPPP